MMLGTSLDVGTAGSLTDSPDNRLRGYQFCFSFQRLGFSISYDEVTRYKKSAVESSTTESANEDVNDDRQKILSVISCRAKQYKERTHFAVHFLSEAALVSLLLEQVFDDDKIETNNSRDQLLEVLQHDDIVDKEAFLETKFCKDVSQPYSKMETTKDLKDLPQSTKKREFNLFDHINMFRGGESGCQDDTKVFERGASDSSANCVIMLETLRVLAHRHSSLEGFVVFLFNGASKTGLQGAHAFITQYRGALDVKAFIDLQSIGAGGQQLLYQADHFMEIAYETSMAMELEAHSEHVETSDLLSSTAVGLPYAGNVEKSPE
ncbi:putative endoplasmic reticulum metallopeptidase 1-A [Nymphon striatum]|nr:putative endoplasmic reticulum metallopeptidase 1-A [Nymphon striatum]